MKTKTLVATKQIAITIICLLLPMNSISQHNDVIKINPYRLVEYNQSLSDIATRIEYVKLETNRESIFGTNGSIQIESLNNYIIIASNSGRILVFNYSGKHIKSFNHKGKGPGEYVTISKLFTNPIDETILVLDERTKKILEYDINGSLRREIVLDKEVKSRTANWLNGNLVYKFYGKQNHGIRVINTQGEVINEIDLGPRNSRSLDISYDCFRIINGRIIYSPHPHTEIMEYSEDLDLIGCTKVVITRNPMPLELSKDDHVFHNNINKFNNILNVYPGRNGYIFFTLIKGAHHFLNYNSQTKQISDIDNNSLINDLDNGPNYKLTGFFSNMKNYSIVEPIKLFEYRDSKEYKQKKERTNMRESEFEVLLNSIKIDDNPILVLAEMK